jgi:hypothetical protein
MRPDPWTIRAFAIRPYANLPRSDSLTADPQTDRRQSVRCPSLYGLASRRFQAHVPPSCNIRRQYRVSSHGSPRQIHGQSAIHYPSYANLPPFVLTLPSAAGSPDRSVRQTALLSVPMLVRRFSPPPPSRSPDKYTLPLLYVMSAYYHSRSRPYRRSVASHPWDPCQ